MNELKYIEFLNRLMELDAQIAELKSYASMEEDMDPAINRGLSLIQDLTSEVLDLSTELRSDCIFEESNH